MIILSFYYYSVEKNNYKISIFDMALNIIHICNIVIPGRIKKAVSNMDTITWLIFVHK